MIRTPSYRPVVALLLLPFFLSACSNNIDLPNFDKDKWVEDKAGCNYRQEKLSSILENKKLLLNKRETDIRLALGEPDRQDLYVRGQKFFYYTINSPKHCLKGDSMALELRFSALGMISEIMTIDY